MRMPLKKYEYYVKIIKDNNMESREYTVAELFKIFGYSPKTNLIDTYLYRFVEKVTSEGYKHGICRVKVIQ